jgi:hypothetical protein
MWRRRTCGALCRGRAPHLLSLCCKCRATIETGPGRFSPSRRSFRPLKSLWLAKCGRTRLSRSTGSSNKTRRFTARPAVYCQKRLTLLSGMGCEVGHSRSKVPVFLESAKGSDRKPKFVHIAHHRALRSNNASLGPDVDGHRCLPCHFEPNLFVNPRLHSSCPALVAASATGLELEQQLSLLLGLMPSRPGSFLAPIPNGLRFAHWESTTLVQPFPSLPIQVEQG